MMHYNQTIDKTRSDIHLICWSELKVIDTTGTVPLAVMDVWAQKYKKTDDFLIHTTIFTTSDVF